MMCVVLALNCLLGLLSKDHRKLLMETRAVTATKTTWMCQSGAVGCTLLTSFPYAYLTSE